MLRKVCAILAASCVALVVTGLTATPAQDQAGQRAKSAALKAIGEDPEVKAVAEKFRAKKVEIGGKTYYVTEGDLLKTEEELIPYAKIQKSRQEQYETFKSLGIDPAKTQGGQSELLSVTEGGKIVKWPANTVLTYCVLRGTFPDEAKYKTVVENFGKAAKGWEGICGVKFQHKQELDKSPGDPDRAGSSSRSCSRTSAGNSSPPPSSPTTLPRNGTSWSTRPITRRVSIGSGSSATNWGTPWASGTSTSARWPRPSARTSRSSTPAH